MCDLFVTSVSMYEPQSCDIGKTSALMSVQWWPVRLP